MTLIDTQTNRIKGTIYVGRSPHEGFFTPNGRELWVAVRDDNYVSVIDPVAMKDVRRIETVNGPGMILFRPDGKLAFVPSSFTPEMDIIDTATYQVVARVPQANPFSPNLAVDQDEVWFTLKNSGKTQVVSAVAPFETLATLNTGPISNHVTFITNSAGRFAYVSVGGKDQVLAYQRTTGFLPKLVATIKVGDLPHGIWGSADGKTVYVGLENGDAVQAIDTVTNRIVATIPVGQLPQALVYVSGAVTSDAGNAELKPLGIATDALHLELVSANGSMARASVAINALGLIDNLQIAATGLIPGKKYKLTINGDHPEDLVVFAAGIGGVAIAQTLGPLKHAVAPQEPASPCGLELRSVDSGELVLQPRKELKSLRARAPRQRNTLGKCCEEASPRLGHLPHCRRPVRPSVHRSLHHLRRSQMPEQTMIRKMPEKHDIRDFLGRAHTPQRDRRFSFLVDSVWIRRSRCQLAPEGCHDRSW